MESDFETTLIIWSKSSQSFEKVAGLMKIAETSMMKISKHKKHVSQKQKY